MDDRITLDYGSGGAKTSELIESILLPAFDNQALSRLGDGALLDGQPETDIFHGQLCRSLPGNSPGRHRKTFRLRNSQRPVHGRRNSSVFESVFYTGRRFLFSDFRRIVSFNAEEAKTAGVSLVTGDTKVVEAGKGDGIYINTAGIGFQRADLPGKPGIRPGDAVLVSGSIGCHGAAVMMARSGLLREDSPLRSDCQPLHRISAAAMDAAADSSSLRILRDPQEEALQPH